MTPTPEEIWSGDMLGRRGEAEMLEQFLLSELGRRRRCGRGSSYVLAIDAAYGQGKSWFLRRFEAQLALNHPVATLDAWVDDADDEPLVAIMAAIEDALAPFLARSSAVTANLKAVSRAALPLIGKALIGAATKATQRYVGDSFLDEAAADLKSAKDENPASSPLGDAVGEGVGKFGEEIANLTDKAAQVLVEKYRERRKSREDFKNRMSALVASIERSEIQLNAPLFVIIDELDRCRPSYAIRVLEEIKHLFDVPDVTFLIALHGSQLTKSINAVYGSGFDSVAYLQRFFDRKYELRRLSVKEITRAELVEDPLDESKLYYPYSTRSDERDLPDFISAVLDDFRVTPRECITVLDGLRIFHDQWTHRAQIELLYLLAQLIFTTRGKELTELNLAEESDRRVIVELPPLLHAEKLTRRPVHQVMSIYDHHRHVLLPDIHQSNPGDEAHNFVWGRMADEFAREHRNQHPLGSKPTSLLREYRAIIGRIRRLQ